MVNLWYKYFDFFDIPVKYRGLYRQILHSIPVCGMTYREAEAMIAGAGEKCFYINRRAAKKCSYKVGVRFCTRPCDHCVELKYAIPVTDCARALLSFSHQRCNLDIAFTVHRCDLGIQQLRTQILWPENRTLACLGSADK